MASENTPSERYRGFEGYLSDNTSAEWPRALAQNRLTLQRCADCGYIRYPPRWLCPECLSAEFEWAELSGRGEIYAFTWYHQTLAPGYEELPYNVVIVTLEEGPRIVSRLDGVDPGEIAVGQPVEAAFSTGAEGEPVLSFRVAP
jgi:uncharacterized OB-fold protein